MTLNAKLSKYLKDLRKSDTKSFDVLIVGAERTFKEKNFMIPAIEKMLVFTLCYTKLEAIPFNTLSFFSFTFEEYQLFAARLTASPLIGSVLETQNLDEDINKARFILICNSFLFICF